MTDDKSKQPWQDDIKVDVNDKSEVEYVHKQFPNKTHQQIIDAIKKAGPYRKDIIKHLQTH